MKIQPSYYGKYSNFFWDFWKFGYISEPVRHSDGVNRFEVEIYDGMTRKIAEARLLALGFVISHRNNINPARVWAEFPSEVSE